MGLHESLQCSNDKLWDQIMFKSKKSLDLNESYKNLRLHVQWIDQELWEPILGRMQFQCGPCKQFLICYGKEGGVSSNV